VLFSQPGATKALGEMPSQARILRWPEGGWPYCRQRSRRSAIPGRPGRMTDGYATGRSTVSGDWKLGPHAGGPSAASDPGSHTNPHDQGQVPSTERPGVADRRLVGPYVSLPMLQMVLSTLLRHGIDHSKLRALGIGRVALHDGNSRVPLRLGLRVWQEAVRLTQDVDLGLHVAESLKPGDFHLLDYTSRTSATLGEGMRRLARYCQILNNAARIEIVREAHNSRLRFHFAVRSRQWAEFTVAALVVGGRQATVSKWSPRAVRFSHRPPADCSEHRRIFAAPVHFECETNEIVIAHEALELPLRQADPALCTILETQLREAIRRLPRGERLVDRVVRVMSEELVEGNPSLESLARRMAASPRTLRRRLHEAGTSHRDLLDGLRRDLALRYLSERETCITDVAQLLGYSEASAFHRSFKRWTGKSPAEYRQGLRPGPAAQR